MPQKPSAKAYSLVLFLVVLDQLTKVGARSWFPQRIEFNRGSAFSVDIPTVIIIVVAAAMLIFFAKAQHKPWWAALFVAGALSNTLDRILWGGVIDWIHYPFGITGNLADIYLTVGVIGLLSTFKRT